MTSESSVNRPPETPLGDAGEVSFEVSSECVSSGRSKKSNRPRRPAGAGTIIPGPSGGWILRLRVLDRVTGRNRTIQRQFRTRRTAEGATKTLLAEWDARQEAALAALEAKKTPDTPSVEFWARTWLRTHTRDHRPRTLATEEGWVERWIIPTLGDRLLCELTPSDLRAAQEKWAEPRTLPARKPRSKTDRPEPRTVELSPTTVANIARLLRTILRAAVADGLKVAPEVLTMKRPKPAPITRDAVPAAEVRKLLTVLTDAPDRARWLVAMLTGLRSGEALGLLWEHVADDCSTIAVRWQLQRFATGAKPPRTMVARHLEGTRWLTEPKSASGVRVVAVPDVAAQALAQWRKDQGPSPHGLVWPLPSGRPGNQASDRRRWTELQALAGVAHPDGRPYTVHELRHTAATLLASTGVAPADLAQVLGHAKVSTTLDYYTHADLTRVRAAGNAAANQLGLAAQKGHE